MATGHILAWLIQFFLTLWFNTFLVVASHDFEESVTEDELAVIPVPLRNDWAAQQICLSYDLSVVGNRWIDLFLSAGLSPHRVHHVLPWHGSGFANLASEATVREVCAEVGIAWERPRNLIFERFPAVMKHYLLLPEEARSAAPRPPWRRRTMLSRAACRHRIPAPPPGQPPPAMQPPPNHAPRAAPPACPTSGPRATAAGSADSALPTAAPARFGPRAASFISPGRARRTLPLYPRRFPRSRRVITAAPS